MQKIMGVQTLSKDVIYSMRDISHRGWRCENKSKW